MEYARLLGASAHERGANAPHNVRRPGTLLGRTRKVQQRYPAGRPVVLVLTFGLALLPGAVACWVWRGPRVAVEHRDDPPGWSLPEVAVLRDGAVGATRWAFAALVVKLASDGHCALVRTRKRLWLRTGPAFTVDLHANLPVLSPFEQTALRQLGRHDTLGGFGFAGSTFRRRTLRDVRADLVKRGGLADRTRRSNVCLVLGLALVAGGGGAACAGLSAVGGAAGIGLGVGSLAAALPRYPVTPAGARRRTLHRAHAERQRDRIRTLLPDQPERVVEILLDALPGLVLERIATPRWLRAVASQLDDATAECRPPDWVQDEVGTTESMADACRILADVLWALGARTPLRERLRPGRIAP